MAATVILATSKADQWRKFADALSGQIPIEIVRTRSGVETIEAARHKKPAAVVIDAALGDMSGKALVKRLLEVDAMICTILVSDEPDEIFHQKTEGLGIAMRLPSNPDPDQADRVAECLRQLALP